MLQNIHIKNLALMEETEVEFTKGLNILTGETGAGKSLLIGSVNLALGAKFDKEMLRHGAEYAFVELVFADEGRGVSDKLKELEIEDNGGQIIISRKMNQGKSIYKINGETVTAKQVKELAEVLIDIHGQHEHQSLLKKSKHLEILDEYSKNDYGDLKEKVSEKYNDVKALKEKLSLEDKGDSEKEREISLAEFELKEIEDAALKLGEDEELEKRYRLMTNSKKISESLSESYMCTGGETSENAGSMIGRAVRALSGVSGFDERLDKLSEQLSEIEGLLSDYNRDISEYIESTEFDPEEFAETEERLNLINRLKSKYGDSIEKIIAYGEKKREDIIKFQDYDAYIASMKRELSKVEEELNSLCKKLSDIRIKNAKKLSKLLINALEGLNFAQTSFNIDVRPEQNVTATGYDDVEFMISVNPGEPMLPLGNTASGGELSRIMLAIKTVLAKEDSIDTLIFDEIDTGISGKTAWKVSEELNTVAGAHQVICITHLAQIAAMADTHFVIEKSSTRDNTITDVRALSEDESLKELARLLGSDELSEAALENARQMKAEAAKVKAGE
ncbi:MAG: DNA repair protein RecN [Lachnospiraceae bacterium]|nr:DNA repair protein RecN [Lachnospiraceae bacterium]